MTADRISLGPITIVGLRDGVFHLDGGAMFGVVPRLIWEKIYPPDDKNRILMGLNSLLVEAGDALLLVETGVGKTPAPKIRRFYSVENDPGLMEAMRSLGAEPEDVDFVINSHLHFDHCGGNTLPRSDGEFVPAFPRARYIIQKGEWEYARNPFLRDKPSYIRETFLPLEEHRRLELVEGRAQITAGVEVVPAPGHTAHHQVVRFSGGGKTLLFLGDMVPMSAHASLPYVMSYDLYPMETIANKKTFLDLALKEDWIVALVHDPRHFFGRIRMREGKYTFVPLEEA